ncbi:ABC transporter permease [Nocardioides sp. AN3]
MDKTTATTITGSAQPATDERDARSATPTAQRAAQWALPLILVALVIVFSVLKPAAFATSGNASTILGSQAVLILVALGAMLPLIVGQFDLSVGANMATASLTLAKAVGEWGWSPASGVVLALAVSTALGVFNGFVVAWVGVDSFVATLAVSSLLSGALVWTTDGTIISGGIPSSLAAFGRHSVGPIPTQFLAVVILAVITQYVLRMTPTGRYLYAIGGSAEASRLSGINVRRLTMAAFAADGLLCGIGGVFLVSKLGSASPTTGPEFLLPAFAACFLGATSIRPGSFNVLGTVLAVLVLAVGTTGLQMLGAPFYIQPIFAGLVLLAASLATRYLRNQQS